LQAKNCTFCGREGNRSLQRPTFMRFPRGATKEATRDVVSSLLLITSVLTVDSAEYRARSLGTFPYDDGATVYSVSSSGKFVGEWNIPGGYKAFLWENGGVRIIDERPPSRSSGGYGVNKAGQVVGWFATDEYYIHAFLWTNGVMHDLGTLNQSCLRLSRGYAINDSRDVVGDSEIENCRFGWARAFLWRSGSMTELSMPANAQESVAQGIDRTGRYIAGGVFSQEFGSHAFLWVDGAFRDLGIAESEGVAVNSSGTVIGRTKGGINRSFIWTTQGGSQPIEIEGGQGLCYVRAINESSQVVGNAIDQNGEMVAFVWEAGSSQVLPRLPGWYATEAWSIDDNGRIFGFAFTEGPTHFVEWIPLRRGIDISLYTPVPTSDEWQAMKQMGMSFAIVGGWGGVSPNTDADDQLAGARLAGLHTAGYSLINFRSNTDGRCQIKNALREFGPEAQYLKFLAVDVEEALVPIGYDTPTQQQKAVLRIKEAVSEVIRAGIKPLIYTEASPWIKITGNSTEFRNLPLWVHTKDHTPDLPSVNFGGWRNPIGEQYEENHTLPGIPRLIVDLNVFETSIFDAGYPLYIYPPPYVGFDFNAGRLFVRWCDEDLSFVLEEAPTVSGPWLPVADQTNPYEVHISGSTPNRFYQLKIQPP
jgi:probable HAF family extracellular repeat protein